MRRCTVCLEPIVGRRRDARCCSTRCRERLRRWRARWLVPALADLQPEGGNGTARDLADLPLDELALPAGTGR